MHLVPRAPSAREALLEQPAHAHLLQVRHALLLLLLETARHVLVVTRAPGQRLRQRLARLRELLQRPLQLGLHNAPCLLFHSKPLRVCAHGVRLPILTPQCVRRR